MSSAKKLKLEFSADLDLLELIREKQREGLIVLYLEQKKILDQRDTRIKALEGELTNALKKLNLLIEFLTKNNAGLHLQNGPTPNDPKAFFNQLLLTLKDNNDWAELYKILQNSVFSPSTEGEPRLESLLSLIESTEEKYLEIEKKYLKLSIGAAKLESQAVVNKEPHVEENHTSVNQDAVAEVLKRDIESLTFMTNKLRNDLQKKEEQLVQETFRRREAEKKLENIPKTFLDSPESLKSLFNLKESLIEQFETQKDAISDLTRRLLALEQMTRQLVPEELTARLWNSLENNHEFQKFLTTSSAEYSRLRRERDQMRELYESANRQIQLANTTLTEQKVVLNNLKSRLKEENQNNHDIAAQLKELCGKQEGQDLKQTIERIESMVVNEVDSIATSYDEILVEMERIRSALSDKDTTISQLQTEKLKIEFHSTSIKKEAEDTQRRAKLLEEAALEMIAKQETKQLVAGHSEFGYDKQLLEKLLEQERRCQRLLGQLTQYFKEDGRSAEKASMERILDERTMELAALTAAKGRLESELKDMEARLRNYQSSPFRSSEQSQDLEVYKKLLTCNSCHQRQKNAAITRCMHVFCRQCLDLRIETRQRKCPSCGENFGANDIRTIYL